MSGITYIYGIKFGRYVKIGFSRDPAARFASLPSGVAKPDDLDTSSREAIFVAPGDERTERLIHGALAQYRVVGEWFLRPAEVIESMRVSSDALGEMIGIRHRWLDSANVAGGLIPGIDF